MPTTADVNPGAAGFVCLHGRLRLATVDRAYADRVEITYPVWSGRINVASRPMVMGLVPWVESSALSFLPEIFVEDLTMVQWLRGHATANTARRYLVDQVLHRLELWDEFSKRVGPGSSYRTRLHTTKRTMKGENR